MSDEPTFYQELERLINGYSKENDSDTPDFILAAYLENCLTVFNQTIQDREKWYKGSKKPKHKEMGDGFTHNEEDCPCWTIPF